MARYMSVRGWVECERENIDEIFEKIDNIIKDYEKYGLSQEYAYRYKSAWVYSEQTTNLLDYVFLGIDIKEMYVDFIIDQFKAISFIDDVDVYAFVTDDEEQKQTLVRFVNGDMIKNETSFDRRYNI